VVPSLDQAPTESYVWAHPGCPVRILLNLNVIEQLQAEVSQATPWRGEIGGLLIRSKRSKSVAIQIVDFIPLPGEPSSSGPRFKLSSDSLAEAIARCPSDCKIAGFYRTDMDQSVRLRAEDMETIQQWFRDPSSIFLVIAADDAGRSAAGFFFWEDGSVAANSSLTFPFEASKLLSEGWPTHAESLKKNRFANLGLFSKIPDWVGASSIWVKVGAIIGLLALIAGIRILTWNRSATQSKTVSPPTLGLQVKREGTKFVIEWNPSAPAIAKAKDANLVIWDGSREGWDGSSDPLYMPLTPAQLRSGNVTYTSFAFTEKVKFRLDTMGTSGAEASESLVSISPFSATNPAPSTALPTPHPEAQVSVPETATATRARPAVEESTRNKPRRFPITSTLRQTNRPLIPMDRKSAAGSLTPVSKRFVPPPPQSFRPFRVAHETVMPEPPNISADLAASAAGSINWGFNPSALAALCPPAIQPSFGPLGNGLCPGSNITPPSGQSNEGVVTITSEPSGARVEINAIPAGVTPVTVQISPVGLGFTITVSKSGFMKWTVQSFSTAHPYSLHAQLRVNPR
jgi:PEGA domain